MRNLEEEDGSSKHAQSFAGLTCLTRACFPGLICFTRLTPSPPGCWARRGPLFGLPCLPPVSLAAPRNKNEKRERAYGQPLPPKSLSAICLPQPLWNVCLAPPEVFPASHSVTYTVGTPHCGPRSCDGMNGRNPWTSSEPPGPHRAPPGSFRSPLASPAPPGSSLPPRLPLPPLASPGSSRPPWPQTPPEIKKGQNAMVGVAS